MRQMIKNAWLFGEELERFSPWDFGFNLRLFCRSLELTRQALLSSDAVSEVSERNAADIQKFLELIHRYENSLHFALVESKSSAGNIPWFSKEITKEQIEEIKKVSKLADEIEEKAWCDAMDLLKERMRHWWD